MIYESITPQYKIKSTLSHPARPEEVIGFIGRNTKLGKGAAIMKDDAIEENVVVVPKETCVSLGVGLRELVVLDGDTVLVMSEQDFEENHESTEVSGRSGDVTIDTIELDNENFYSYSETEVEVSN